MNQQVSHSRGKPGKVIENKIGKSHRYLGIKWILFYVLHCEIIIVQILTAKKNKVLYRVKNYLTEYYTMIL